MLDFTRMDAKAFEGFVAQLFQKMGFRTQLTQTTGDGGIDIVAHYGGVIFEGTYLIQCKHWSKNVGEPPIRDLYGVVQSENALKGIVVSSGDFSQKAKEFCKGKNLELINGDTLRKLSLSLNEGLQTSQTVYSKETKGFLDYPDFPKERYKILTNQIEQTPKLKDTYQKLFQIFFEHTLNMKSKARSNGLLDDFFYYAQRYKDEFARKNDDESKGNRIGINYTLALLHFIRGELISVYQLLIDLKEGYQFKTQVNVKGWWGLPHNFTKFCTLMFYSLLVTVNPKKEEKDKAPQIYYLLNFYHDTWDWGYAVRSEEISVPLEEFLKEFKIKETEEFQKQVEILREILNEELYSYGWIYKEMQDQP
ncbi:restriction endonuclease [Bacillaceae bacterium S4-13-58]